MVFHRPFLHCILGQFPNADVLMGKPMPQSALSAFVHELESTHTNPQQTCNHVQWLIDTHDRCAQYLAFAQAHHLKLRVNLEIDIGLHRGGYSTPDDMHATLELIINNSEHLEFSGFMGYEAHIASTPHGNPKRIEKTRLNAMQRYRSFKTYVKLNFTPLYNHNLTFNSGGTQTYQLHTNEDTFNDICIGSSLLSPSDFDRATHTGATPAVFIASPVLKKIKGTHIPFLEKPSVLLSRIIPSWRTSIFIYGGYWKAHPTYPQGLRTNALYGRSSNQEMLTTAHDNINIDDYVFLRPTQSEEVLLQFNEMLLVKNNTIIDTMWTPLTIPLKNHSVRSNP